MPLIVGNWKMKLSPMKAEKLCAALADRASEFMGASVVLCPSFESIAACSQILKKGSASIKLGAQDCCWDDKGAYTGAVSPMSLKELGCSYCIVGHSERRAFFGETDDMIAKKISYLLARTSITPILCVGETQKERTQGIQKKVIRRQLEKALSSIETIKVRHIVIAYEPVWAIGTSVTCTQKDCSSIVSYCDSILQKYSSKLSWKIVYGGSVSSENCASFVAKGVADGVLVGSASVDAKEFISLIQNSITL